MRARLDGWMQRKRRGLSGAADRPAVQGRPVQPDLPARYAGPVLCDAAQAVRQIAAVGACGRPRVSRHRSAEQAGLSGREGLCALHRRRRDRLRLLHHVDGRGPGVLGSARCRARRRRRGARSSPARSRRWPNCTPSIREAIGLGDFGKPGNYFARQVDRWTKQYRASETQHIPEFEKLAEWLPKTVPEQKRVSIVHGDYRLDNMIFHATEPRVQAVLDWELSTLGDPMADFTYLLMQWTMPGLADADLKALNIPSMEEAAQIYCNVTGNGGAGPELVFLLQSVPPRRHHAGYRGPDSRRHRRQRQGDRVRQAHRAAVEGVLGIRAKGGRDLRRGRDLTRGRAFFV